MDAEFQQQRFVEMTDEAGDALRSRHDQMVRAYPVALVEQKHGTERLVEDALVILPHVPAMAELLLQKLGLRSRMVKNVVAGG